MFTGNLKQDFKAKASKKLHVQPKTSNFEIAAVFNEIEGFLTLTNANAQIFEKKLGSGYTIVLRDSKHEIFPLYYEGLLNFSLSLKQELSSNSTTAGYFVSGHIKHQTGRNSVLLTFEHKTVS